VLSGDSLYVENSLSSLLLLLKKGEKVYGARKRIKGYGLNESDFDDGNCTRKIFRKRIAEFKEKRLIEELKSKYKKRNYYAITPLGIAVLFHYNRIEENYDVISKIIIILKFYFKNYLQKFHDKNRLSEMNLINSKIFDRLINGLKVKTVLKNLKLVFEGIKIDRNLVGYDIFVSYSLANLLIVNFFKFSIKNKKLYENYHGLSTHNVEIDNRYCFSEISEFVLLALTYKLVNQFFTLEKVNIKIKKGGKDKMKSIIDKRILREAYEFNERLLILLKSKSHTLNSTKELIVQIKETL